MVARFTSKAVELPEREAGADFYRADLAFYGVDHSGSSYEARVFLNHPGANVSTPRDHPSYAGSFHVFGHGGCFGDKGHCDIPEDEPDPFDLRPPHQLTPATKTVIVTEALRRNASPSDGSLKVTVVAEAPGDESNSVLSFDTVRLLTYD